VERKKKSRKEVVLELVEKRGLASYMNTTKWKELKRAVIEEMPFQPQYCMKTVDGVIDETKLSSSTAYAGEGHWGYLDSLEEYLSWDCFATPFWAIEWIKVKPKKQEVFRGRLIDPKIIEEVDATDEFVAILERYNIPYEEENGVYTICGYRGA